MKVLVLVVDWCILFMLAWPLALLVLFLAPLISLLALPFRLVGVCIAATSRSLRLCFSCRLAYWGIAG